MTRSLSIAPLKAHLSEIVGEVQHTRAQIVIEKHGKPVAMLISGLIRRDSLTKLHQRIARVPARAQCTSSITLAELNYGAHEIGKVDLYARARLILADLEVLSFDRAAAERYGPLRARLEKRGAKMGEADLRIASISLVHGCTLVTGNVRHFARVDELEVEDWLAD